MVAATSEEETPDTRAPPADTMVEPQTGGGSSKPTDDPNDDPKDDPTHEFQNLIVTKTADATFDREYKWDIDKSVVGDQKVWISEGEKATIDYVVKVTPKGVHDSNWRITGTITVQNPNEWSVEADVTDRVTFGTSLAPTSGQQDGGPGEDDGTKCDVADGKKATIPAEGSKEFQYSCEFESAPGESGTNTATAKWKPQHQGDEHVSRMEPMSGSSDDGHHENGKRSASGSVNFTFEASEINRTVSVYDDKTNPDSAWLLGESDYETGPFEYPYSLQISGVVGKCTNYTNTAWLDYGDSEGSDPSIQPLSGSGGTTEEQDDGKDSDSATVSVCVKRVPPPPTWTDETCKTDGSQKLGSISIPVSDFYQYKIDGVEVAAGTYVREAGTYVVTAKYNGPRGHDMEAASLVPFSGEGYRSGRSGRSRQRRGRQRRGQWLGLRQDVDLDHRHRRHARLPSPDQGRRSR